MATLCLLGLAGACDFFDTTEVELQATNERNLKQLQWALVTPTGMEAADTELSGGHGNDSAGHDAETGSHSEGSDAEEDKPAARPTTAAVLAVVDSFYLLEANEDTDLAEFAALSELADRRERVVRQELQKVLVNNTLISVMQPNEEQISAARAEVLAKNSAALSSTHVEELSTNLRVKHVVSALIDVDGTEVNVVAQTVPEGTIVFQETFYSWDILKDMQQLPVEEAE